MAFDAETIKSYLVGLGFSVDNKSYDRFQQYLKDADNFVDRHIAGIAKSYLTASTAIVGALAAVTTSTVALMDGVAQADLGYQKFALHMFMGVRQAREMKIATDALGESLQDIAWMPELRGRYFELMREERGLDNPLEAGGAESAYRHMRDIRFEWTRLKMEMTYGSRYIGYYLMRYLAGPAGTIESKFKQLNDWLQTNMPVWTDKVAKVLTAIIGLGRSAIRFIGDVAGGLKALWGHLDKFSKGVIIAGGIIEAFILSGPFGQALMVISGLILLIDDFYAYIDGRKSSATLAPVWEELIEAGRLINNLFTELSVTFGKFDNKLGESQGQVSQWRLLIWNLGADVVRVTWALDSLVRVLAAGKLAVTGHFKDAWNMLEGIGGDYWKADQALKASNPRNIAAVESGGNYNAVNKDTGAYGKYQIMPGNWAEWSREAGLPVGAPMTPANQDVVARFKLAQYSKEFGGDHRLVAAAWYAGEPYARGLAAGHPKFSPDAPQWKNGTEYPSVNQYIYNATGQTWGSNMAYLQRGSSGSVHIDNSIGNIHVSVTQPNASADEIGAEVLKKIQGNQGKQTARHTREFAGVLG